MDNINVSDLIGNILNRANGIVDCLPGYLQDNIREVIDCVRIFSLEQGINYNINNFFYHGKLSLENLYMTLNSISKDLGICILLFPKNVNLEDAAYNIGVIISYMIKCDFEFYSWYYDGKRKIK